MENPVTETEPDKSRSLRPIARFEWVLSAVFVVMLLLAAAATLGVMSSGMPPLFNQRAAIYNLCNAICLAGLLLLAGTLASSLYLKRLESLRRVILLFLITLSTVEGLLFVFDRHFISAEGSPLQSAFRNLWVHGDPIWLAQPTPASPFGFRIP